MVENFEKGAPACQKNELPACYCKNSESAYMHGAFVTDNVASFVKEGFVSGPFMEPPCSKFRVNPLSAIQQDGKVRLILNVSMPEKSSFNDNVDDLKLEKLKMSSAKLFGYSIMKCGKDAKMYKFDMKDAYKNIPAKIADLRLQGFSWLNRFFVENCQIFGAKTSPQNFDVCNNTLVKLSSCDVLCSKVFIHRHLDDVPFVCPKHCPHGDNFAENYLKLCKDLNLTITDDCEKKEKAFKNSTTGKVLGIIFDTKNQTWKLTEKKICNINELAIRAIKQNELKIVEFQSLLGRLNFVGSMCPFLSQFKYTMNCCLKKALHSGSKTVIFTESAVADLKICMNIVNEKNPLPIPSEPASKPVVCKKFISDAAGYSDSNLNDLPGVATIGFSEEGVVIFGFRRFWRKKLIQEGQDVNGKAFGRKTAFLELIGLLIPFCLVPEILGGQHVVFEVDNLACFYGWENGYMSNDEYSSIVLRAIKIASARLNCRVHVVHVPRLSSWESELVDRLSRKSTTTKMDDRLVDSFGFQMPEELAEWLDNPTVNWSIPIKILKIIEQKIKN